MRELATAETKERENKRYSPFQQATGTTTTTARVLHDHRGLSTREKLYRNLFTYCFKILLMAQVVFNASHRHRGSGNGTGNNRTGLDCIVLQLLPLAQQQKKRKAKREKEKRCRCGRGWKKSQFKFFRLNFFPACFASKQIFFLSFPINSRQIFVPFFLLIFFCCGKFIIAIVGKAINAKRYNIYVKSVTNYLRNEEKYHRNGMGMSLMMRFWFEFNFHPSVHD